MSGGHYDYRNDSLCSELFGWSVSPDYGIGTAREYKKNVTLARKANPMEDKMMSELVYDVFCLMHSLDWYQSGDTCRETYLQDVKAFKKKWMKLPEESMIRQEIDKTLEEARKELLTSLLDQPETEE